MEAVEIATKPIGSLTLTIPGLCKPYFVRAPPSRLLLGLSAQSYYFHCLGKLGNSCPGPIFTEDLTDLCVRWRPGCLLEEVIVHHGPGLV